MAQLDTLQEAARQDFAVRLTQFVIYLENCDGPGWNRLQSDLGDIWKAVKPDDYLSLAAARTSLFVEQFFNRCYLASDSDAMTKAFRQRQELITAASVEIACGAANEFKLGNFS